MAGGRRRQEELGEAGAALDGRGGTAAHQRQEARPCPRNGITVVAWWRQAVTGSDPGAEVEQLLYLGTGVAQRPNPGTVAAQLPDPGEGAARRPDLGPVAAGSRGRGGGGAGGIRADEVGDWVVFLSAGSGRSPRAL